MDEPRTLAISVLVEPVCPQMAPAKAVSPEIASLLPPLGILRDRPPVPPAVAQTTPALAFTKPNRERPSAAGSSLAMTIAIIATTMGVAALAMIPALDWRRDRPNLPNTAVADDPSRFVAADSAKDDRLPAPSLVEGPRPPKPEPPIASDDVPQAGPADDKALNTYLAEIESLLRERDVVGATAKMRLVEVQPWSERQFATIAQHAALVSAVHGFWEGFNDALNAVAAGRSVTWGGREGVVVEADASHLIIHRAGQNVRITRSEFSKELVRALAESLLDLNDPRNQVHLGAYLFVTEGPESREVRRLWENAAANGESVALLMPLLTQP